MKILRCLGGGGLLLVFALAFCGCASVKTDPGMSLSIAVPALSFDSERAVVAVDRQSHFPVILSNVSNKPRRIATEWNSWGEQALSFEITDSTGKTSVARRVSLDRAKNTLHWWIVEPGESLVMDVYFANPQKWEGFPHPARYGQSETVTLRAVFEFELAQRKPFPDDLWMGRVVSKPAQIVFYNRTPGTE